MSNRAKGRWTATKLAGLGALLAVVVGASARAAEPSDPAAIMNELYRVSTEGRRVSRIEMTIADDAGREKVRNVLVRSLRAEGERKNLVLVENPADVRGTGFVTITPERGSGGERWMYLPSLKRATRIASSEMSGSFLGSDFSYADLSQPSPDLFKFTMKEPQVNVDGEDCWLVQAQPKDADAEKTLGYKQLELWISKRAFVAVRIRATMASGNKVKYIKASDLRRVGNYWMAHRIEARTVAQDRLLSKTALAVKQAATNDPSVTDADFTKARLEQGL